MSNIFKKIYNVSYWVGDFPFAFVRWIVKFHKNNDADDLAFFYIMGLPVASLISFFIGLVAFASYNGMSATTEDIMVAKAISNCTNATFDRRFMDKKNHVITKDDIKTLIKDCEDYYKSEAQKAVRS